MPSSIFTSIFLFFFLHLISLHLHHQCFAQQQYPLPNGIEYLGSGYDIYFGNPHVTGGLFDPGFSDKENVFQLVPSQQLFQNQYAIPIGTEIRADDTCELDFVTSDVFGAQSYFDSLEISVSADFSGFGAAFSASSDYKTVQQGSSSSHSIYTSTKATCAFYDTFITPDNPPAITDAFHNAVSSNLPSEFDHYSYKNFISNWGTHYVKGMTTGGRFGQISSLSQETWLKSQAIGFDLNVAASYSGLGASGSFSAMTQQQQNLAQNFSSMATSQTFFTVGGKPPSNLSVQDWLNSVQAFPMPILYELDPIFLLLTPQLFPDDVNITLKASILENYILNQYCQDLLSDGQLTSCSVPPPDPPAPQLPKETCRFCDTNCGGDYPLLVGQAQHSGDWGPYSMFASGCSDPYTTTWDVMNVCCHEEPDPQCKMCLSCGGEYPNEMGRKLNQYDWPQWLSFDNACGGSLQPTLSEVALCCQNTLTCRFCDGCGDHMTEVGRIVHQGDWGPYQMFPQQSCTPGVMDNYGQQGGGAGLEPILCCPANITGPSS